jgi:GDP-L-fucose synthase
MKVLVTGSNGLVGTALKEILGDNHIYHTKNDVNLLDPILTNEYITFHTKNSGVDTIIHCAAKVGGIEANSNNNDGFFRENYIISNNVIYSAFENKIPNFVNLLSTCVFPDKNITYPLTSDQIDLGAPHSSNYGYSYAKRLSGYQTKIFRQLSGLNWISVIPTNVYGPNDNFKPEQSHMIPGIIHRAYHSKINNEKFNIWGDGTPLRQFIHSKDLAKNILWAIENWKKETPFMIINETEHSVMEIVKIITNKFEIDKNNIKFDSSKPSGQFRKPAKTDIPPDYKYVDINNGLSDTIDWYIKNYNTLRK